MGKLYEKSLAFINNWQAPNDVKIEKMKISVIIPAYRARHLKKVLKHLSDINEIYEVIVVFDGREDFVENIVDEYSFNIKIIQHDKNYNAATARNTGSVYATGEILLFLDSDMILSPKFISNLPHYLQANANAAVVLGFRDTLELSQIPSLNNWEEANYKNDWRITTNIGENFLDLTISNCGSINNNCNKNEQLEILKTTNGFRTLGTSKKNTIGFWDLPCMTISHTLAISKTAFFEIGGFPEWTKGWGGEDIAFGFLATAAHLPIIPVEIGSYHIKHEPLSGSEEKKWAEMRENLKRYKIWANSIDEFPIIDKERCLSRSKILYKNNK